MTHWNSSPHPISDIRDWEEVGRLELAPDFQRREVWSPSARIMLIDTVLRDIPMPKIFVASSIRDGRTYRAVIDGQQRIRALFAFLRDEFALEAPYTGSEQGKLFSQLDLETQNRFLSYNIDFNEAVNPTEKETREVYSRVNKYTVVLNKQELRRADYPGDFLRVAETIALDDFFDRARIFTPADRRRAADVEYASELLAGMLKGVQDGKSSLDSIYQEYSVWNSEDLESTTKQFRSVLAEMDLLFPPSDQRPLSETRFRQKADFYTLFLCVLDYVRDDLTLRSKDLQPLQADLRDLDEMIRPESDIRICSEYAIKCVSQANSGSSRRWRKLFLSSLLDGTYRSAFPEGASAELYYSILDDCAYDSSGMCPDPEYYCPACRGRITDVHEAQLAWKRSDTVYQLDNSLWIGSGCLKDAKDFTLAPRREKDAKAYFPR